MHLEDPLGHRIQVSIFSNDNALNAPIERLKTSINEWIIIKNFVFDNTNRQFSAFNEAVTITINSSQFSTFIFETQRDTAPKLHRLLVNYFKTT